MNTLRSSILRRVSHVDVVLDLLKNKSSRSLLKKNKKFFQKIIMILPLKRFPFHMIKQKHLEILVSI